MEINHIKEKFKEKNRYVNPAKYLSITHQTQKNNYYCGPYAAALLAYYEDYIDNGVIPNSIRAKGSTSAGSTYGNHWVLAYQVREDSVGKGWYKCVDNHGRYNAIIQASWTAGNGWLSI
ncbi:MAG: hypothetical protein EOM50_04685 [Erysipelotrichia bacterium]|nr:hypothetical protein [Erysipelotrichia bacterium]